MSARMRAGLALAVALVGVGVASCRGGEERAERVPSAEEAMASPAPEGRATTEQIGDAEIAAIVVAANGIDVRFGELAREHAVNPRVQQFAEAMITAHTAVNENAGALVQRLGVTPVESDVSRSLEAAAAETMETLRSKSGRGFDRAYIANEVAYHRQVLGALDDLLIPSAHSAELRETLVNVRPAFEAHLRHAESLQQELDES